jgi:hypothetical protein
MSALGLAYPMVLLQRNKSRRKYEASTLHGDEVMADISIALRQPIQGGLRLKPIDSMMPPGVDDPCRASLFARAAFSRKGKDVKRRG